MAINFIRRLLLPAEEYQLISWLFLKFLALIYFAAFLSLTVQITGLVGPNGILPFQEMLDHVFSEFGYAAWWRLPNVFWLNSSDLALQGAGILGCVFSVFLFLGYRQKLSLTLLFFLYLSLFHAGQTFLTFQWDSLLLESGFLAIFLVGGPTHLVIFLYHWLLFRLRLMSGISKFVSNDPSWSNLTALNHYFETQPLPHIGAWYAHQLPEWLLKFGVLFTFFAELIVPFFIFLPRPFRLFAAATTLVAQSLIIATSNHNWVNLLTILLCLFLLDDRIVSAVLPTRLKSTINKTSQISWGKKYLLPLAAVLILTTSVSMYYRYATGGRLPTIVDEYVTLVRSWGIGHIYHIFPTMQIARHELQVEGSVDGKEWRTYTFRYKPGPLDQRPAFIIPHQPRLDWSIWFVPAQYPDSMYWTQRFLTRLEEGSPQVLSLLEHNPFPDKPPRLLRIQVFDYQFTTTQEREASGNWWKYKYLGLFPFLPPRFP